MLYWIWQDSKQIAWWSVSVLLTLLLVATFNIKELKGYNMTCVIGDSVGNDKGFGDSLIQAK